LELVAGYAEQLDFQIVSGDGTGENFTGILNTAGTLTQAWDTDIFTTMRKVLALLETTGYAATAWAFHANDLAAIELTKDGTGLPAQPMLGGADADTLPAVHRQQISHRGHQPGHAALTVPITAAASPSANRHAASCGDGPQPPDGGAGGRSGGRSTTGMSPTLTTGCDI
jgi:hypothetical protein